MSVTNGSAALTPSEIAEIQSATALVGQGVLYEEWAGVNGNSLEDLISYPEFPGNPSATMVRPSFDAFVDKADNFGARMSGWVKAPESGDYTFWITTDDFGELFADSLRYPPCAIFIHRKEPSAIEKSLQL